MTINDDGSRYQSQLRLSRERRESLGYGMCRINQRLHGSRFHPSSTLIDEY
ncbi:hypothetical protein KPSA3_02136 [Pseudomonas syringae pv. actinidiae]|uniref:Uncharacterized protein n=1 Tax=Pseudomonas syringae pv. actinidiae TaxID=103796 RepID=A0AAN4Q2Z9_PSESF|nr:hypothetical protein KPSA3_02136 [Pseudomonas syringae pv. actinidiae]